MEVTRGYQEGGGGTSPSSKTASGSGGNLASGCSRQSLANDDETSLGCGHVLHPFPTGHSEPRPTAVESSTIIDCQHTRDTEGNKQLIHFH